MYFGLLDCEIDRFSRPKSVRNSALDLPTFRPLESILEGFPTLVRAAIAIFRAILAMGFISFAGRVLFSSIFILAAWQKINDFGTDGGAAAKSMEPKFGLFKNHVTTLLGYQVPDVEMKHLLMAAIGLEGIGSILFIFGSTLGAHMLLIFLAAMTPIMHDFYNYDMATPDYVSEFIQFLKNLSLFGALLFFLGMKNSFSKKPKKKGTKSKTN